MLPFDKSYFLLNRCYKKFAKFHFLPVCVLRCPDIVISLIVLILPRLWKCHHVLYCRIIDFKSIFPKALKFIYQNIYLQV